VADVLPERQRRLIVLQALGCSYAELATLTGDTPRTVDRQLARAKRRLDALHEPLHLTDTPIPAARGRRPDALHQETR
jgi:DNA-directed RNA polymerase specialized sigma24 family protein